MLVHFLASGCLFFWVLIGVDPTPRKLPYIAKMLLLFVTMPFHAFFGIALMNIGTPDRRRLVHRAAPAWGVSILSDQHTGGSIAWAFGEIPTFIVLIAMVFQWFADDRRLARRLERQRRPGRGGRGRRRAVGLQRLPRLARQAAAQRVTR